MPSNKAAAANRHQAYRAAPSRAELRALVHTPSRPPLFQTQVTEDGGGGVVREDVPEVMNIDTVYRRE